MTARAFKTVNVGGLTWTVISAGERSTSHGGRHFFASRCSSRHHWRLDEVNQAEINGSRILCMISGAVDTKDLSFRVKHYVEAGNS